MNAGTPTDLELVLFATEPRVVRRALASDIGSLMVDLEWRGKHDRQQRWNTEVNRDSPEDLEVLRRAGARRRYCRVDRFGAWTADQIESVLAHGASHVMLPMVTRPSEVEAFIAAVDGRAATAILVETEPAVAAIDALARLPIDALYVGLNDLAISRGTPSLWQSMLDGTVDRVREALLDAGGRIRFGVAGVTVVDGGAPIPASMLLAELARLECDFSFLRRSFRREIAGRDWHHETRRIQSAWRRLADRSATRIEADRRRFVAHLRSLEGTLSSRFVPA